jgi:HNH endonuclease
MPQCIFCLQEKERLTDEHVFPAALGGVLVLADSVCAECNNGFSKFEQPLVAELAPLRLLLKIPDRYGKFPQVPATVKTQDKEYEARVKSDGTVQLKPVVTEVEGIKGAREFLYQFATERQKARLREEARAKGVEFIESGPGDPELGEVHVGGELEFIGSVGGLRTAAKIAYVGLGERAGAKVATSDSFDEVRAYVREGTGKSASRLFVHERFLEAVQQGPHQHSLILAARHDKGRVDAIVRLFGGLCYFVKLSDHYAGADFSYTLVNDAHRGELNVVLQSHVDVEMLETEDVATSDETVWDDLAASAERFCKFLDSEIQSKMERDRAKVSEKS